jgi:hypothetical protein
VKKIIFILCIAFLIRPVLPVFDYVFNYDYITTALCVNKANTIIGCDGKCYLIKQLAKASESEKPLSSDKKHTTIDKTDLFFGEIQNNVVVFKNFQQRDSHFRHADLYSDPSLKSVFRPPASIS